MNQLLAEKIIKEVSKFSQKGYAICDRFGEVLAQTSSFSLAHNPVDIHGKRSLPIIFEGKKTGYLYIDEDLKTVKEIGKVLKSLAELVIHQNYFAEILTSDEKRIDQLIYEFLRSADLNEKEMERQLGSFGIDFSKNRLAIALEITDPSYLFLYEKEVVEGERERKIARIKRGLKNALDSFYTHHKENLICYLGSNNFAIFKDMGGDPKAYQEEFKKTLNSLYYVFKSELRTDLTVGVGEFKSGIAGLKDSFSEAQTAINFGKKVWGEGKIFHFDSFGVVAPLFSGVSEKNISFSMGILEKISKHPELLETLKCYLEFDLSLSKTAKKLKIHRNTLVYRLDKIAEISELDPKLFNDAFQLQIALILERYSA